MLDRISVFVRSRNAFLGLLICVSALKVLLCAVAPASFDLRDIVKLVGLRMTGPWIALYPPLYSLSPNFAQLEQWALAPPGFTSQFSPMSFLFRLPILALDLGTMIVLYHIGKKLASPVEGRLVSLIWFLNPYSTLGIELLGVPDILAIFLVLVSFSLFVSRRPLWSGLFLGLSIWIKLFPVILLPPILLYAHRHAVSRKGELAILCFGFAGLIGYLSWLIPFGAEYLTQYSAVTQPLPFFTAEYTINAAAFWLILLYCLMGLFAKKTTTLLEILLPTFLVYYLLSNPQPQYLVWAMPLMALDLALLKRFRAAIFAVTYALAFAQWFFTSSVFLTPSGYSLLLFPVVPVALMLRIFDSPLLGVIVMPFISSGLYAAIVIYVVDIARSWFAFPRPRVK